MTTTFFLVRHAAHDNVGGFLAGRTPGVVLGNAGLAQAERLARRMHREQFVAIHASPRERTRQTAEAISNVCGVTVAIAPELDEIDFGAWSNRTFDDLNQDPEWRRWNTVRTLASTPAGETVFDVQSRSLGLVVRLARQHSGSAVVLVSHADIIKAVVCFYLGLALDAWPRFEISPASISTLEVDDWGAKIVTLNEQSD